MPLESPTPRVALLLRRPFLAIESGFVHPCGRNQVVDHSKLKSRGGRKLALFRTIPNQILFSFSSDNDRRTDSRIRRKITAQPRRESNPGSCERDPGFDSRRLRCVFSSDPAVSSSIFVGAEREEKLISRDCVFGMKVKHRLSEFAHTQMEKVWSRIILVHKIFFF